MEFKDQIDNECGFHIKRRGSFCAPDEIVNKIKTVSKLDHISDKTVLNNLKKKYNCDTEICVLKQPEIKSIVGRENIDLIINEYFKPTGPRDNNKWLSNNDIDSVLFQMKKKYENKHFYHINFQMIDFEKMQTELATLNWPEKYKEGYRCFGTVLNTDVSTNNGKHWFALFASFQDSDEEFTVEYFNSSGELPMNQITEYMKKVKHMWQSHFTKPINDIIVTRIVNQFDGWNCGSYSLYYIISRLNGVPYSYFRTNHIGDDNMQLFRTYLFRDNN